LTSVELEKQIKNDIREKTSKTSDIMLKDLIEEVLSLIDW